jgi:hypothetical protein
MQFRLENKQIEAAIDGFTSVSSAHRHLFKHVVPLYEYFQKQDKESWGEILPDPPMERSYERRVKRWRAQLEKSAQCLMVEERCVESCERCRNFNAQVRVGEMVKEILDVWLAEATRTVHWSLGNLSPDGHPRAICGSKPRWQLCISYGGFAGVADCSYRESAEGAAAFGDLLSLYGRGKKEKLRADWLDLCRDMAGARRAGTYRPIEKLE